MILMKRVWNEALEYYVNQLRILFCFPNIDRRQNNLNTIIHIMKQTLRNWSSKFNFDKSNY